MGLYSVLDDIDFLKREFPELLPDSLKPTRWYKCRICSNQFTTRRLLEAHKKIALKHPSVCFKEDK